MKRSFGLLVALLLALAMPVAALSHDASPEAAEPAPPFVTSAGLGVSEFDIVVTDDGFDVPSSIPAGRYLVNVTNNASDAASASFFMPPADWTLEQVQAAFAPPEGEDAPPPDFSWLYRSPIAGGASALPGATGQAVIDLQPGRWVVWGDDPESAIPMAEVQVTGAMPDTLRPMTPTVTITATSTGTGYGFDVIGDVVAGPQLVEFYNKTDQPHFVAAMVSPVPLDDDQFMQVMMGQEDGTPGPDSGLPSMEEMQFSPSGITAISAGLKIWAVMDFAPGHNIIVCFVTDLNSPEMLPHSAEGMFEQIEVA